MQKTMRIVANIFNIAVLLVMLINLEVFIVKDDIQLFTIESPLVFAFLVAVVLFVLIVLNLINEFRQGRASGGTASEEKSVLKQLAPVGIFAAATIAYVLLLRYLHFLAGSFFFMMLGMFFLNETTKKIGPRILKAGMACLITVPILYLVFNVIFNVVLP